jgi:hypothetical protein
VSRFVDGHLSEGWQTHRVNDVLPLGSISNVHGIMSNGHHMYDAAVNRNDIFCLCQQTNVRRDELCEQPVPGAQEGRAMVAPRHSGYLTAICRQPATAAINLGI